MVILGTKKPQIDTAVLKKFAKYVPPLFPSSPYGSPKAGRRQQVSPSNADLSML